MRNERMTQLRERKRLTIRAMARMCSGGQGRQGLKYKCSVRLLEILEAGGVTTPAWAQTIARAYGMTKAQQALITCRRLPNRESQDEPESI